ncbi:FG-GAP repeat protein [bacterium]|nr:FG-GAP repeat protein [bacterium]
MLLLSFFPADVSGQNLFPSPTGSFHGTSISQRIGYALSPAGDVNGDGLDDFLIGTFHYNIPFWDMGACHLILGRRKAEFQMDMSTDQVDARFIGPGERRALAYEVHAGDVNGDGYSDILMGAPAGHPDVAVPGYAYLVFGRKNIDWGLNANINNAADVIFVGEHNFSLAGMSVSVIGDMDGDGCSEIAISAPYYDDVGAGTDNNHGRVYFLRGRETGWESPFYLRNADAIFSINSWYAFLGYCVSGIGDINGDTIPDFAISATGNNRIFVFFGRSEMDWGVGYNVENADIIITPEYNTGFFGWMIRRVGDVNNDGFGDFMFSDFMYDNNRGIAYIIFGRDTFPSSLAAGGLPSYVGEEIRDHAGYRFSGIGDFDFDGFDDILLGAFAYSHPTLRNGKAYIIRGKSDNWGIHVNLNTIPDAKVGTDADSMHFGNNVTGTGDLNGDGSPDFAVAAPFSDVNGWSDAGRVFIYFGEGRPPVSGTCMYINGEKIEGAQLHITARDTVLTTDNSGFYLFPVREGGDFEVRPSKSDYLQTTGGAISAYDAALAARHSVGLESLSGYPLICADADENGILEMCDASWIARASVGLAKTGGSKAGEWRFEPESRFYSSSGPFGEQEDYTAYLIGDVNGDWSASAQSGKIAATGSTGAYAASDTFYIPVQTGTDYSMLAADIVFSYDDQVLEFLGIEKTVTSNHFSLVFNDQEHGSVKAAVFGTEPIQSSSSFIKIYFRTISEEDCETVIHWDFFRINETIINYEDTAIYTEVGTGQEHDIDLTLFRNYPNPFNPVTTINYRIPAAGHVVLNIYNAQGQIVASVSSDHSGAGNYTYRWDGTDLAGSEVGSGIYIGQLMFGSEIKTIKMVKMK